MTTIDLQALVTAKEAAGLAAANAQIAADDVDIARMMVLLDWQAAASDKNIPLNLTGFTEVWRDDFNTDSIMDNNGSPAGGKWYSPVRSTFGFGTFAKSQVTVANGECRIRAERISPPSPTSAWGTWKTGHIQTMNAAGQGFAQGLPPGGAYYVEARMKFPVQDFAWGWEANTGNPLNPQHPADIYGRRASWPSFWSLSQNDFIPDGNGHLIEDDHMECYGGDVNHHATVHLKPRDVPQQGEPTSRITRGQLTNLNAQQWNGYHTYGTMYDDQYITRYYDGKSICRYVMNKFFKVPLFLNISHAIFEDHMWAASSPMDMFIDNVRVLVK
jgi:hypothetical protein